MTTEIETYQNELTYQEMLRAGVGSVSMPTTHGIMTKDEIADYTEELMYFGEMHGFDAVRAPSPVHRAVVVVDRTKSLLGGVVNSETAKKIGDGLRDWNERLEAQERKKPPLFPQ